MPKSIMMRVTPKFKEECIQLANERAFKGLIKDRVKERGTAEISELITRSPHWQGVKEDLKTKPKKENVKGIF